MKHICSTLQGLSLIFATWIDTAAATTTATTTLVTSDEATMASQAPKHVYKQMRPNPPIPDYPDLEKPRTERIEFLNMGRSNSVWCWPSVGGVIMAERVSSVELDFIDVDRFTPVERSYDPAEEDAFCRKVRLIGGKWWESEEDFEMTMGKIRELTTEEKEVLHLGWPAGGGVWVIRVPNRGFHWYGEERHNNAHTMEERCKALEMEGATFFEDPRNCEYVEPLLRGFGEWKPKSKYRHDHKEL